LSAVTDPCEALRMRLSSDDVVLTLESPLGRDPLSRRDGHRSIPSTIEAAALCKMADRGQITGGELDGPLAFDNAISPEKNLTFLSNGVVLGARVPIILTSRADNVRMRMASCAVAALLRHSQLQQPIRA